MLYNIYILRPGIDAMTQLERLLIETDEARHNMVECQLRPNGVTDEKLIQAFKSVNRENFAPPDAQSLIYSDASIFLPANTYQKLDRWLLPPLILGKLLQVAVIQSHHNVLIIGGATGYSMALVSQLADNVVMLEVEPNLAINAQNYVNQEKISNVVVATGPLIEGYLFKAPYDIIIFEGALIDIPSNFTQQLKSNGCFVTILKGENCFGRGIVATIQSNKIIVNEKFDANCPWLTGFSSSKGFYL